MKIRIQGNSIRYRLRKSEVANFKQCGSITEVLELGNGELQQLRFVLQLGQGSEVTVQNTCQTTILYVPESIAGEWTETDLVGFHASVETGTGRMLEILVEKDFKCLDGKDDDPIDAYPNPAEQCK